MKGFMRIVRGALCMGVVALAMIASPMAVEALTSNLTCTIAGTTCTASASFGTLTFTQVGGDVQLAIDLTGTLNKILDVELNYQPGPAGTTLSVSGSATTLTFSADNVNADGCVNCFDISVPATGNLGATDTATLLFHSSAGALSIANLFLLNSAGLDAAVHIGNLGPGACSGATCTPGTTGDGSAFAGETAAVPEAGTLLFVGTALVGLGVLGRKRLLKAVAA